MNRQDDLLKQIVRIAKSGREYFVGVYPAIVDADLRMAFVYMCEVKSQLISDLKRWVPEVDEEPQDHVSPAAIVEKTYRDARANFRSTNPAANAKALSFGEEQLSRLVERVFDISTDVKLKKMLKTYYAQLLICLEAMRRLHARLAA